jgi:tRNA (mo5U34)-methyltransferase
MTAAEAIAANPRWYHSIELAPGEVTPGMVDLRGLAGHVLPGRIEGRALDVGTFDGFWAFELERRGASEVVAVDVADAPDAEWPPLQRERLEREAAAMGVELGLGFRLASDALGSRARRVVADVRTLTAGDIGGPVDVAFLGSLLLHLRDPIGALERLRAVTDTLYLLEPVALRETLLAPRRPVARYQPLETTFNWWLPNLAALKAWVYAAGFDHVRFRGFRRPDGREGMDVWLAVLEAR